MTFLYMVFVVLAVVILLWICGLRLLWNPVRATRRRFFSTFLLEHIAALVRLRLPLAKGIADCGGDISFGSASDLRYLADGLNEGLLLGDALAEDKMVRPAEAEALRIAEMSGDLGRGIALVLKDRRRFAHLRGWLQGTFLYVGAIMVVMSGILAGIMTFIVPKFKRMFDELDVALPTMTRSLVSGADIVQHTWPFLLFLLVPLFVIAKRPAWLTRSLHRGAHDVSDAFYRAVYWIPFLHGATRRELLAEFCRELAMLLRIGTPAHRALYVIAEGTMNPWFRDRVKEAAQLCEEGIDLGAALDRARVDRRTGWFARASVRTSDLADALGALGEDYMEQVAWPILVAVRVTPPALVVCLGIFVGYVVISLFLPLVALSNSMGG